MRGGGRGGALALELSVEGLLGIDRSLGRFFFCWGGDFKDFKD